MHTIYQNKSGRPIVRIGHRGAAGHAPENTIAAIHQGISLGADFIELDVRCTCDGQLVLMHDELVDRTTNGAGILSRLTWDRLQLLDAGGGERLPSLEAALAAVSGCAGVMLEVKAPNTGPAICRFVQASAFSGPVVCASFLHEEILAIHRIDPLAKTMLLIEDLPTCAAALARQTHATLVGLSIDFLTAEVVRSLHNAGVGVWCYTVNEHRLIRSAIELGVDGVISDFPERVPRTCVRPIPAGLRTNAPVETAFSTPNA